MTQDVAAAIDIDTRERATIERLLRRYLPGVEVWAYGSRVRWNARPQSDLDVVAFASPEQSGAVSQLREAFEESSLPFSVYLLIWDDLPESFHTNIEAAYVILQSAKAENVNNQLIEAPFAELLAEPLRNGIYKKKEFHGSGVKIVNMGELFAHPRLGDIGMKRVELAGSEQDRFSVQAGDLLFARRSLVAEGAGKCSVVLDVSEPTTFESSIIRARPDRKKADSLFLYYYFNSPSGLHALDTIRRQVAVAGITGSDLAQLEIPHTPLPEQRAIAHILGTLDDKIELNRRMNQTLGEMARAIFQDWFVDFGSVRAKLEGREPYLPPELWDLFPDRLVDSELGEVPEGWGVGVLNDSIEILSGGTPKTSVSAYWDGDVPWYTAKDAPTLSDIFALNTERSITQAGIDNSSTKVLPARTTVITARGTVGRLACLGIPMAMNQTCYGIRGAEGYSDFFTYWSVRNTVSELQARTHGTIFDTITRETFKIAETVLVPTNAARAFESVVNPTMQRILMNLNESISLTAQRDTLLPKLVSGAIKIKV